MSAQPPLPTLTARVKRHRTLSENTAFRVAAALDEDSGRHLTVVEATARANREAAANALRRLLSAHLEPAHPQVAQALGLIDGEHGLAVAFDFPGCIDLDNFVQIGTAGGWKVGYEAADGFSNTLRDAFLAMAGRGRMLGTFALGNVILGVDGRHVVIGWGHNVVAHDEYHRLVVRGRHFQAPEVALGAPSTPTSELVAIIEMTRSLMPFVRVHPRLARAIVQQGAKVDLELVRLILAFESRVMRGPPHRRPPIDRIVAMSDRIRAILGSVPDPQGFRKFAAELIARECPHLLDPARRPLRVGADGLWFEAPGLARVDLGRFRIQGRLLRFLAERRAAGLLTGLQADELFQLGWPGEHILAEAARNRVYVAIAALRKAGLGDLLERDVTGYRLSPTVDVVLMAPGDDG